MKQKRSESIAWQRIGMMVLLVLFLTGCGENGTDQQKKESTPILSLYYLVDLENGAAGHREVVKAVPVNLAPADATPEALLKRLSQPPEEGLLSPLPEGTEVNECIPEGNCLTVDFSEPYGTLTGYDLTCANCAIGLTLTQLLEVEKVVFTVNGGALPNWEQVALENKMVMLPSEESKSDFIEVPLYFWNPQKGVLQAESRTMLLDREVELAAKVLYALIDGPKEDGLEALLPKDTTLLSVSIENRCCIITLSDEFWQSVPESKEQQKMVLYSIVHSLKGLEFVDSVQIQSAAGWTAYGSFSLKEPFS
jgi:germination protein M